jgi:branched-chain amino acid transport system ATP-binding protein
MTARLQEIKARGLAVLIVDQNVDAALILADHAYVLSAGRVVLQGTPEEFRASGALHQAYLGAEQ